MYVLFKYDNNTYTLSWSASFPSCCGSFCVVWQWRYQLIFLCCLVVQSVNVVDTHHQHNESMTGKKFSCDRCPYESNYNKDVKRHIQGVHEKIKRYAYEDCSSAFTQRSSYIVDEVYMTISKIMFVESVGLPSPGKWIWKDIREESIKWLEIVNVPIAQNHLVKQQL